MKISILILVFSTFLLGCVSSPDIHQAARQGDVVMLNRLLDEGVFPDVQDQWGQRALHYASREGHLEVVTALLDRGADPDGLDDRNGRPLHYTCDPNILTLLLEHGADIRAQYEDKSTPLHGAVLCPQQQVQLARILIDAGADPDAKNDLDLTPLHLAVGYADTELVSLLLDRDVDVNAENIQGLTAMDMAIVTGKTGFADLLSAKGGKSKKYFSPDTAKAHFERGKFIGKDGGNPLKKKFESDSGFVLFQFRLDREGTTDTEYYTYRGFETVYGRFFAEPGHSYTMDVYGEVFPRKTYAVARDKATGQIVGFFR